MLGANRSKKIMDELYIICHVLSVTSFHKSELILCAQYLNSNPCFVFLFFFSLNIVYSYSLRDCVFISYVLLPFDTMTNIHIFGFFHVLPMSRETSTLLCFLHFVAFMSATVFTLVSLMNLGNFMGENRIRNF